MGAWKGRMLPLPGPSGRFGSMPLRLASLLDHQDGARGVGHDLAGHAADEEALDSTGALVADDDEVDVVLLGVLDDGVGRRGGLLHDDLDIGIGGLGLVLDLLHGLLHGRPRLLKVFARNLAKIKVRERGGGHGQGDDVGTFLGRRVQSLFEHQGCVIGMIESCQNLHGDDLLSVVRLGGTTFMPLGVNGCGDLEPGKS